MEKPVKFEVAKKLKDLGFVGDLDTRYYYVVTEHEAHYDCEGSFLLKPGELIDTSSESVWLQKDKVIEAPLISEAAEWIRENKGISVEPFMMMKTKALYSIVTLTDKGIKDITRSEGEYGSWSEALEAGIMEVLRKWEK